MKFGKFMWEGVIGFITKAYDGYDALRESIRKIGGDEAVEKFDKVAELLKKIINGALIAAAIALVARPFMRNRRKGGGGGGPCPPCKPCVCRVPDPQRVPALATQLAAVTQLVPDAVMDPARSPAFNWGRIFDPIRNILGALQKRKSEDVINPVIDDILEPAYATIKQSFEEGMDLVTGPALRALNADQEKIEKVLPLTTATEKAVEPKVYYQDQFDDLPVTEVSPLAPVGGIINVTGKIISILGAWGLSLMGINVPQAREGGVVPPISPIDKSYDDLATNTSYSTGSYGMITNTTTIIQPVVQEV